MDIRFALAQKDPEGDSTNGITRIRSDTTEYSTSESSDFAFKRAHSWNPDRYLNIYVVREIAGNNVAGFSYLPPHASGRAMDGIVIGYEFFGRLMDEAHNPKYNKGKTLTHEVGHYFNLLHTWGDGDCPDGDEIHDTPDASGTYFSSFRDDCPAPEQCGNRRMIENYMDYSDDPCSKVFTRGQKDRMRDAIFRWRASLVSYENLIQTSLEEQYAEINQEREEVRKVDIFPNPVFKGHQDLNIYTVYPEKAQTEFRLINMKGEVVWQKAEEVANRKFSINTNRMERGAYFLRVNRDDKSFSKRVMIEGPGEE